jgi:hypothetical protein
MDKQVARGIEDGAPDRLSIPFMALFDTHGFVCLLFLGAML